MSFDPHARRFNPLRMFPAIETDGEETSETPDEFLFCWDEESTNGPAGQDFDEALEQIASERCCVCPLCGAIVASNGSVVGGRKRDQDPFSRGAGQSRSVPEENGS